MLEMPAREIVGASTEEVIIGLAYWLDQSLMPVTFDELLNVVSISLAPITQLLN